MRDALPEIRARGADLVVVGCGQPAHAAEFRKTYGGDFPLLVDPDLVAYRAAGLRRGLWATLHPGNLGGWVRAVRAGHRQGKIRGDPYQQGGVFVIVPGGGVRYAHANRGASDNAPIEEILRALAPAPGSRT